MALHSSTEVHLGGSPSGAVMEEGYSLDLALDQVGIFSKSKHKATQRGLKSLSKFEGIDKERELISILMGSKSRHGRNGTDKNKRTIDFTLKDIKRVGISHPKQKELEVDYWRIGWDGIHDETSIKFVPGEVAELSIGISGVAVSFYNQEPNYTVKTSVVIPNPEDNRPCGNVGSICDPVDCREHTIQLVKNLRDYDLPNGGKFSDLFEVYPIFSTPKTDPVGETFKQYKLSYCGSAGINEVAKVASQYSGVKVNRDSKGDIILTAPSDYVVKPYKETKADILKGCESCLEGYTLVPKGFVFGVSLEDEGVDKKDVVAGLPNAIADTAVKIGSEYGIGRYFVMTSEILKDEQITAFVEANPTATIVYAGSKEAFCKNDAEITHEWEEIGSFSNTCHEYRIVVADDCAGDRLAELQAYYPNLTIEKVESKNCLSIYKTKVYTNPSCTEGCNPQIIQEIYSSETPAKFGLNNYWFPHIEKGESEAVSCGIEIKAKPIVLSGSECIADEFPFIMTSTRITSIAGGYNSDLGLGSYVPDVLWTNTNITRAKDLDNLAGDLRGWEQKGQFYFEDQYPATSAIERQLSGTYSRLDQLEQASDLFIEVNTHHKSGFETRSYQGLTYHILVPYGRSKKLEEVFKNLAGSAGVPFEVK